MRSLGNSLFDILDSYTGEWVVFEKTTIGYDGTTIVSANEYLYIDSVTYIKLDDNVAGGGYAKRILYDNKINVKSYGVVGDGITNDFIPFRKAINFTAQAGIQLLFPKGVDISFVGTIVAPQGCKLVFEGGTIVSGGLTGTQTEIRTGIFQIFSTNVVLDGSFSMDYICPQHFGAITNPLLTVFENDISVELQACIDSPMKVKLPMGFYYLSNTVEITQPKEIILEGKGAPDSTTSDHGRIYTDQNIDLIIIKSKYVYIRGGVIDVIRADGYTANVITYDLNYGMWGGEIDSILVGSRLNVIQAGIGGTALYFKGTDITENGGYAVFINIKGFFEYFHTGIKADDRDIVHNNYVNNLIITTDMQGMKKYIDAGSNVISSSSITGRYQDDSTVLANPTELAFFCVELDCVDTYVDIRISDPDLRPTTLFSINEVASINFENYIGSRTQSYYNLGRVTGDVFGGGLTSGGFWNNPFKLGAYFMWVDATGALRIKHTPAPTSDLDGVKVGSQ